MTTSAHARSADAVDREAMADLLAAIAEREDRDAFARIFNYYAPRVKGYLLRLGAGDAQAEEIVQDVMLTVWRKAATFDRTQASVSTWLFRIARNRRIDLIRRQAKGDIDPMEPLLQPSETPQPDEQISALEREERVRAAVADLPVEQAELLRMAFFEGKSHREIADTAGVALGTVKSRLRLAFVKLRRALGDDAEP
ncbi:MAG: sigma-70 family RNA polymerase sigma factor [Pseudomonadota bacterium]